MIKYQFPVVFFYGDDPEDNTITMHDARMTIDKANESVVTLHLHTLEQTLTVNVAATDEGYFVCVPQKHLGCYVECLLDIEDNHYQLLHNGENINYEEATAIAYALREIYEHFKVH